MRLNVLAVFPTPIVRRCCTVRPITARGSASNAFCTVATGNDWRYEISVSLFLFLRRFDAGKFIGF